LDGRARRPLILNATFAMRRKGLITFEKNGKGRGKFRTRQISLAG
jgi:hypothetical protein